MLKPTNRAATRPDHTDPRLRTQRYHQPLQKLWRVVADTIPKLKTYGRRWRLVAVPTNREPLTPEEEQTVGNQGSIVIIQAEVPVLIFTK